MCGDRHCRTHANVARAARADPTRGSDVSATLITQSLDCFSTIGKSLSARPASVEGVTADQERELLQNALALRTVLSRSEPEADSDRLVPPDRPSGAQRADCLRSRP